MASNPNRGLTGRSCGLRPVAIVLNSDNRLEPDGTPGQLAVGFETALKSVPSPFQKEPVIGLKDMDTFVTVTVNFRAVIG